MKPTTFRRDGDEFLAVWETAGIGIGFSRIRESDSGMLFAELDVQSSRPDASGTLLSPTRFNMMAATERKRLAEILGSRAADVPWADALEVAIGRVIREWRTPEPLVDLWDVEDPGSMTYLHRPLLVENDTNVWYADEQSLKSYLAMATAASVVSGLELPGVGWPSKTGTVIYYDWETFDARQRRRLTRVVNGFGLPSLRNIKYRRMTRPLMDVVGLIRAEVSRLGAVLVIFDSLAFMCGGDLNKPEVSLPTMNAIGSIQGATRLILAHHGKSARTEGNAPSVFGSIFFEAASRNRWLIRKSQSEGSKVINLGLYSQKTSDDERHAPIGLAFTFDDARDSVTVSRAAIEDDAELMKTATAAARIRAMLRNAEYGRATVQEIAEEIGLAGATVRKELNGMQDAINLTSAEGGKGKMGVWGLLDDAPYGRRNGAVHTVPSNRSEPFRPEQYADDEPDSLPW